MTPTNFASVCKAALEFRSLQHEIALAFFDRSDSQDASMLEQISGMRARMYRWFNDLAAPLKSQNIALPMHFRLHMEYYTTMITLLRVEKDMLPNQSSSQPHAASAKIEETSSLAFSRLETLLRLYHRRHSYDLYEAYLLIFLHALGNHAADILAQEDDASADVLQARRSLLLLCVKGLHDQGKNGSLLYNVNLILKDRMQPREKLILEAHVTQEDLYDDPESMAQYNHSQYPVPIIKINEDPEAVFVKNYINKRQASSTAAAR